MFCCLQVKALHHYPADDVDELSFEAGEIIAVIPFDDTDEQVCALYRFHDVLLNRTITSNSFILETSCTSAILGLTCIHT